MFAYNLRMAFKSFRRNPILSILVIGAIGLGIGVSTTFITTQYLLSADPIPQKSSRLHYVMMDNWDPNRPWNDSEPNDPPNQITYRDMVAVMKSDIPKYQGGSFRASLFVHPDPKVGRPYKVIARMCFSDFFPLFDVPFEYGNGWDRRADRAPEPVAVLGYKTNQKLFGGENSVGRSVRVEDRDFKVVGVLKTWRPLPKYYDPHNGRNVIVQTLEELKAKTYMPDVNVARILGAVIILLVFVTALGIVGMTSFPVTERTRQIGTRRAIGARRLDILRYFLTENWIITSLGVVLGVMLTYYWSS